MEIEAFLAEWHNDSPTLLVHTSGSTGTPKPLLVEKERMRASALTTCDYLGLKPGDTTLLCMPLDYIAGKMVVVRSVVRQLRLIAVPPDGHPLAEANSPRFPVPFSLDFAAMVPLQVWNSLQVPAERERLMAIRHLIIGGGAIDDGLARQLRTFPNAVWSTYGMTETLSHIALRRLSGPEASEWYTPLGGVRLSLNDEQCLVIDAPAVHDGPLTTNDIAEIKAPEGRPCPQDSGKPGGGMVFRILGRRDNVICSGGIKIQAEEVEQRLRGQLRRPFCITKRMDGKFGEIVVLLTEDPDLGGVEAICSRVLPKYWQPRLCRTVAQIPMTETGKVARAKAMEMAAE